MSERLIKSLGRLYYYKKISEETVLSVVNKNNLSDEDKDRILKYNPSEE